MATETPETTSLLTEDCILRVPAGSKLDDQLISILVDLAIVERLSSGQFHELARRSGLSRSTVSGVLQGKRGASLDTLRKLSGASGVELGKLTEYVESQRKREDNEMSQTERLKKENGRLMREAHERLLGGES